MACNGNAFFHKVRKAQQAAEEQSNAEPAVNPYEALQEGFEEAPLPLPSEPEPLSSSTTREAAGPESDSNAKQESSGG
jgi:hypothetical protein